MEKENPAVVVCPFRAENGLTIKLKIEPDGNRHILTWYMDGADDAKNADDDAEITDESPDPAHLTWYKFKQSNLRLRTKGGKFSRGEIDAIMRYRNCAANMKNPAKRAEILWLMCHGLDDYDIGLRTGVSFADIANFRAVYSMGLFDNIQ